VGATLRFAGSSLLALSVGCGRTQLAPGTGQEGGGSPQSSGSGGDIAGTSAGAMGGETTGRPSSSACLDGPATWSCAPAVWTGECCYGIGVEQPQCGETCTLVDHPLGAPCDTPGQTTTATVAMQIPQNCEGGLVSCYVSNCICGCRDGATAPIAGLAGSCEPTLFANRIHHPTDVALSDEFVFWTAYGSCPLTTFGDDGDGRLFGARRVDGSAAMVIGDVPCPGDVVAIDDDIYWTNHPGAAGGSLWTAKNDGQQVRILADRLNYPTTIHADANDVYWFDVGGIYKVSRRHPDPPELFTAIEHLDSGIESAFVIDEGYVYWLDEGRFKEGGIFRAQKSGGDPERLIGSTQPLELAISTAGLFYVEELRYQEFAISFWARDDATTTMLTMTTLRPQALVAFDNEVYWTEGEHRMPGAVYRMQEGESQPSLIASGQADPGSMAVDAQYLFWTAHNFPGSPGYNGQVMRACRP
jgi:hypothetical protein